MFWNGKRFLTNSINIEHGLMKLVGANGNLFSIYVRDSDENFIEISNIIDL